MVAIRFTTRSLYDIDDIAEFTSSKSAKYAALFVDTVFAKIDYLKSYPRIGRIVPEFADEAIRELIYNQYRIIYKIINEEQVDILTIQHSSRMLNKALLT